MHNICQGIFKYVKIFDGVENALLFDSMSLIPDIFLVIIKVGKISQRGEIDSNKNDNYCCTAFIAQDYEFSGKTKTHNLNNQLLNTEGENSDYLNETKREESVIGRKTRDKLIEEKDKLLISEKINLEFRDNIISHKVINIDDEKEIGNLKDLKVENPSERVDQKNKLSNALLRHV